MVVMINHAHHMYSNELDPDYFYIISHSCNFSYFKYTCYSLIPWLCMSIRFFNNVVNILLTNDLMNLLMHCHCKTRLFSPNVVVSLYFSVQTIQ